MDKRITKVTDKKRGCGYRKVGGLYLIGDGPSISCGRFPIPLTVCPCCGHGVKYARGWSWIDADKFIPVDHNECGTGNCSYCPIFNILEKGIGRAGLLWVGESFYPTVESFIKEAHSLGLSRRIKSVPREFIVGETWVLLAHAKAIREPLEMGKAPEFTAGIFKMFKPSRIEVICDGSESEETITDYINRGLTPVIVEIDENDPVPVELISERRVQ